jgi:hypothetical protein
MNTRSRRVRRGFSGGLTRFRLDDAGAVVVCLMEQRPLQTIDCSGRLTTVTLPILTRN